MTKPTNKSKKSIKVCMNGQDGRSRSIYPCEGCGHTHYIRVKEVLCDKCLKKAENDVHEKM